MLDYVPEEILTAELDEGPWHGDSRPRTLQEELDSVGEEVEHCEFKIADSSGELGYTKLEHFVAWTDSKVLVLITGEFGIQHLLQIPRNP